MQNTLEKDVYDYIDFAEDARKFEDKEDREDDRHHMAVIRTVLVVVDELIKRQEHEQGDYEYCNC